MSLRINIKNPSAELTDSAINHAITLLATLVASKMKEVPQQPILELTFMLPGKLEKPAFSGMRMGGYNNNEHTLFFEKAVPEHILHSPRSIAYVAAVLDDVVENASDFFADTSTEFNTPSWQQLASAIRADLKKQGLH